MSNWTHIVATIDVETNIEDKNIKNIVEKILEKAPKITGSEDDAEIFVNVLNGHNVSTNCDCKSCEYKDTIIHHKEGGYSCEADQDYKCPWGEYQTRVVITVMGDLRDRLKHKTEKEYNKFYHYIDKDCNFWIRNKTVKIISD
jgi:hypothetical protein